MARLTDDHLGAQAILAVDQKIAALLTAIEQEPIPERLTRLARELQNALIDRRRRETTN